MMIKNGGASLTFKRERYFRCREMLYFNLFVNTSSIYARSSKPIQKLSNGRPFQAYAEKSM